jgi:hypothetical protein
MYLFQLNGGIGLPYAFSFVTPTNILFFESAKKWVFVIVEKA